MRDSFVNAVLTLMEERDDVILLTADLGFGIFDEITERFPERFVNCGVAEQNMMGVASGLGMEGWRVFAYSIGNFATLRCLEQIRNDAAYHDANVTVVASGGGFTYGQLGMSHHATEDLSILRALPGVDVVVPCDAFESGAATKALAMRDGVGYLRIEKNVNYNTQDDGGPFEIGNARQIRQGKDIAFMAIGSLVGEALDAADALKSHGVSASVYSIHSLTPFDKQAILDASTSHRAVVTIEENTVAGGLGGAVAEVLAEAGNACKFKRIGMQEIYSSVVGDQNYLRRHYAIDKQSLMETAGQMLDVDVTGALKAISA